MAAWPVVLGMNVGDYKCARKIKEAIRDMPGVRSVSASREQGLVVVHGSADAWALRRRIWRKMKRRASVLSDGSTPYSSYQGPTAAAPYPYGYLQGPTAAPYYGPSQAYSRVSVPYYSQPPARSYSYAAGRGYGDRWADPEPEPYYYGQHSTVPWCSIM
uniref:Uncharacterized protein n=1 Tax=Avena sativa TaxID=4498 RepID=A0ACD6ABB0_AVESA